MPHIITQLEAHDQYFRNNNKSFNSSKDAIDFYLKVFSQRVEKCVANVSRGNVDCNEKEFELFQTDTGMFTEHLFLNKVLKWYIRTHVLNDILLALFAIHKINDKVRIIREENHIAQYGMSLAFSFNYDNKSFEERYPFEFIVETNGETIGYRYLPFPSFYTYDMQKKLLADYKVDKINIIEWQEDCSLREVESEIKRIHLKRLFEIYFTIEEYNYYLAASRKAIADANKNIGLQAIPQMGVRYVSEFRMNVINDLVNINYHMLRFKTKTGKVLGSGLSNSDYSILDSNFIDKGLLKALLGRESFAKSFMTSEYLSHIFRDVNSFDYTTVVTGYLKSVEQLTYKVVKSALSYCEDKNLYIKLKNMKKYPEHVYKHSQKNKDTNKRMVLFNAKYEKYFDVSMAPLVWFLHDSPFCWKLSENSREIVHECLIEFSRECRNEYFHKNNIYTTEEVNRIRENTIFCLYLILGGCRFSEKGEDDSVNLGIINDAFDRLYMALEKTAFGSKAFRLTMKDGIKYEVLKIYQERAQYNKDGQIDSEIWFYIMDKKLTLEERKSLFKKRVFPKEKVIVINRDNMPLEIERFRHNKYERIEW